MSSLSRCDARHLGSLLARLESTQDLVRRDWRTIESDADSIVYRVGYRRNHRRERSLADFLRPEWPFGVERLDNHAVEIGRVEAGRDLVLEKRRLLVQALAED